MIPYTTVEQIVPTRQYRKTRHYETDGPLTTEVTTEDTTPRTRRVVVQQKRFIASDVQAGPMRLGRCTAAADESGRFIFSGVLFHEGGDVGALRGGQATVHVRLLSDLSDPSDGLKATSIAIIEGTFWVRKNVPRTIHLQIEPKHKIDVQRHFADSTHAEVILNERGNRGAAVASE